jgi:hypothetical protein
MAKVVKLARISKNDVDLLGYYLAEAADWIAKAEVLKKRIKKAGPGSYEGVFYRATMAEYEEKRLNMKAVRAKLSKQFIRANTTTSMKQVVKIVSKQGKKLKKVANDVG